MGSKLTDAAGLIALAIVVAMSGAAHAQPAPTVSDLVKQGSEAFKAGKYDDAIAAFTKAYEIEPRSDTLFALAQAERLGGQCKLAIPHYKKLLEQLNDLEKAKLVQSNLDLCEKSEPIAKPVEPIKVEPTPPVAPAKTIIRVERRSDPLAIALVAGGALGLGAGTGLYIAANASRDAADDARTLEDNRRFNDRADVQRALSFTAYGVGVGLVGYAVYRWVRGKEPSAGVAISPSRDATTVTVGLTW